LQLLKLWVSVNHWSAVFDVVYNFSARLDSPKLIPGVHMTFSSFPGMLFSGDDFYTMSSGIVSAASLQIVVAITGYGSVAGSGTIAGSGAALLSVCAQMSLCVINVLLSSLCIVTAAHAIKVSFSGGHGVRFFLGQLLRGVWII
jgi:hypothetical protein